MNITKNLTRFAVVALATLLLAGVSAPRQAQAGMDVLPLTVWNPNLSNTVAQAAVATGDMCGVIAQIDIDIESGFTQNLALVTASGATLWAATGAAADVSLAIRQPVVSSAGAAFSGTVLGTQVVSWQTGTNTVFTTNTQVIAAGVVPFSVCGGVYLRSWSASAVSNDTTAYIIYDKIEP